MSRPATPSATSPAATSGSLAQARASSVLRRELGLITTSRLLFLSSLASRGWPAGDRGFLSMLMCMKRECEQPALHSHPECMKMREQEDSQRERRQ